MGGEFFGEPVFLGGRGSLRKRGSFSFGKIFLGLEIFGARDAFFEREVFDDLVLFDRVVLLDVLREDLAVEELVFFGLRAMMEGNRC